MPIYEYKCNECEHTFEDYLSVSNRDKPLKKPCPECGVREVPSLTPNGKPALRCTDNCNLIASRKVQAAGKAKIGITATGTATIKKGKKIYQ